MLPWLLFSASLVMLALVAMTRSTDAALQEYAQLLFEENVQLKADNQTIRAELSEVLPALLHNQSIVLQLDTEYPDQVRRIKNALLEQKTRADYRVPASSFSDA